MILCILTEFKERNKSMGTDERKYRILLKSTVNERSQEALKTVWNCQFLSKALGKKKVVLLKYKIILLSLCVYKGNSSTGRGNM